MSRKSYSFLSVSLVCAMIGCAGCGGQVIEPAPIRLAGTEGAPQEPVPRHEPDRIIPPAARAPAAPDAKDVAPLFEKYCLNCHDAADAQGGVVLENASDASDEKLKPLLIRVAENLRSQSMPPEGEPQPDAAELETICAWIDGVVGKTDQQAGHRAPRRLNRAQYNNTIRDLVGIDLRPADEFPSDDVGYGFDNIGDVLSISPVLLEMYLSAAEKMVDAVFASPERRVRIMNPPADFVPLAFRRYKSPVRAPRENKVLRTGPPAVDPELKRQQKIYDILRAFADRAYRRPATYDELSRLLSIVISAEKDGESAESAIRLALEAVLVSPHFLFVGVEPTASPQTVLPPQDFELAARLSYFLWSSTPDDELLRLASRGALRRRDCLETQVKRMLRDFRARSLAEQFASQWLQTRKLATFTPDSQLFPDFDPELKRAMLDEVELFFVSIVAEDRSVLDLLDADFTFVNERLARHYGIAGVEGERFRRVSLEGTSRGGVITIASVLAATSNPTRTSPVKRGRWTLENILGAPPAPPPAGVEAFKETAALAGTLRHRMEQHRSNPECASCHRRMDPPGFALENFDALGSWREHDAGQTIDAGGRLPGGRAFHGPEGLKRALRARRDAFAHGLTEKLLTFALGRGASPADGPAVAQIASRLARNGYRFSTLVLGIVESESFGHNEAEGDGS